MSPQTLYLDPNTIPTWTALSFHPDGARRPLLFWSPSLPSEVNEVDQDIRPPSARPLSNFHPVSAAEFLTNEPEPVNWVWQHYLAAGRLTLLSAYAKAGKSTFAYPLAVAVAQGRGFLEFATTPGPVLILAVEEHAQDVQRRLYQFGMKPDDPIHIHTGPLDPHDLPAIEAFIRERGIRLVLLDTLSRFWRIKDENDNAEIIRAVGPLLEMAQRTECAVLVIHHEKKKTGEDGGDDGIRAIRGGSALAGIVDQSLQLAKPHGGGSNRRVLKAVGRYAETPPELLIELEGTDYRRVDEVPEKVWSALTDQPQTEDHFVKAVKVSRSTFQRAIEALGDRVIREGKGVKGNPYTYRRDPQALWQKPVDADGALARV
jgi:hypothetical protein